MTADTTEHLLTGKEAAAHLRISERFLRTLALDGTITSVVIGKRRLYRIADLDAFIRAQVVNGK